MEFIINPEVSQIVSICAMFLEERFSFIFLEKPLDTPVYIVYIYSMNKEKSPLPLSLPAVTPAAGGPLYDQIIQHLRREIAEGRLPAHTPLPSFRQLARDLMVSLITVKRAYEELERQGLIYRRQGLGTFVADEGVDRVRQAKRARVEELLSEAAKEAGEAGFSPQEWKTWTEKSWKKSKRESER